MCFPTKPALCCKPLQVEENYHNTILLQDWVSDAEEAFTDQCT